MKPAKLNLEQTIRRVSQMRKLGLSLREAHDKQYRLEGWLKRVAELRALPDERCQTEVSTADLNALRAAFREFWRQRDFAAIVEVAAKLPETIVAHDDLLLAYTASARERIDERTHASNSKEGHQQISRDETRKKEALRFTEAVIGDVS